jgi:DNA-directed RNA polymerase subunit K/omega
LNSPGEGIKDLHDLSSSVLRKTFIPFGYQEAKDRKGNELKVFDKFDKDSQSKIRLVSLLCKDSTKEELMDLDATEKFDEMYKNRYEAILLVAKHARRINLERVREQSQEEEEKISQDKQPKVITQAMKDVLEGKVDFERQDKS